MIKFKFYAEVDYLDSLPLWLLSGMPLYISKGKSYELEIKIPSCLRHTRVIYVDNYVAITNEHREYYLLDNKVSKWQKVLIDNDELTMEEKAILLLYLDTYCGKNNNLITYNTKTIKFNTLNSVTDEDEVLFTTNSNKKHL